MEIITNSVPRDLLHWHDLTEQERADFDWITPETMQAEFFRYRGSTYCMLDFVCAPAAGPLEKYDGVAMDTYFSGIAVRFARDDYGVPELDAVIVARFYS